MCVKIFHAVQSVDNCKKWRGEGEYSASKDVFWNIFKKAFYWVGGNMIGMKILSYQTETVCLLISDPVFEVSSPQNTAAEKEELLSFRRTFILYSVYSLLPSTKQTLSF